MSCVNLISTMELSENTGWIELVSMPWSLVLFIKNTIVIQKVDGKDGSDTYPLTSKHEIRDGWVSGLQKNLK